MDAELADALYAVESDHSHNPFAQDVGPLLNALHTAGVRIGVVSDIHFDIRPGFAQHRDQSGTPWADLVDAWALSFELRLARPESAIFTIASKSSGSRPANAFMVGDLGPWDGAAADLGITTLLLPALRSVEDLRLHGVLDLVLPGAVLETSTESAT